MSGACATMSGTMGAGMVDSEAAAMSLAQESQLMLSEELLEDRDLAEGQRVALALCEEDCESVRSKIASFLSKKTMTQVDFLRSIGCSSDSLSRFMKLKGGWNGVHNGVYWGARKFFASLSSDWPSHSRKRRHSDEQQKGAAIKKSRLQIRAEKRALKTSNEELFRSVAKVHLEGGSVKGWVPVYDDCDEVRAKSLEFINQCRLRIREWLRMIGDVNNKSWNDFVSYRGPASGAANRAYYSAYIFLEKVRIARGDGKSRARELAEAQFGPAGRPLRHDSKSRGPSVENQGMLRFVKSIRLEGELEGRVPVYDDCDEVRRKSLDFISSYGIRVSEWLRLIGGVNSKSWRDFVSYSGERAGAANKAYYAAYVLLEKLRIASNQEKSSKRILAEIEFGETGRLLKHEPRHKWFEPPPEIIDDIPEL